MADVPTGAAAATDNAANAPVTTATPSQLIAASGAQPSAAAASIPILAIAHQIDYAKLRNTILVLIAAWAGVQFIMMLVTYALEK